MYFERKNDENLQNKGARARTCIDKERSNQYNFFRYIGVINKVLLIIPKRKERDYV